MPVCILSVTALVLQKTGWDGCDRAPSQACRALSTCPLGLSRNSWRMPAVWSEISRKLLVWGVEGRTQVRREGALSDLGGPWPGLLEQWAEALGGWSRAPTPGALVPWEALGAPVLMAQGQGRVSSLHPSLPPRLRILGSLAESSMQTKASFYLCPPISVSLRTSAVPSRHSAFSNPDCAQGMNHGAMWLWRRCPGSWLGHLPAGGRRLSLHCEAQVSEHQDWVEGTGRTHSLHLPLLGHVFLPNPPRGEPRSMPQRSPRVLSPGIPSL